MKKFLRKAIFAIIVIFSFASTPVLAAEPNLYPSQTNAVEPKVQLDTEVFTYTGYNSVPYSITVGPSIKLGTLWLMADYTWTETWTVDEHGNKVNFVSSTSPKITHGDYMIDSIGDITVLSETLASDGSSYAVKISIKYTNPPTGISYSKYQTFTLYSSQL